MKEYKCRVSSCFGCPDHHYLRDDRVGVDLCGTELKLIMKEGHNLPVPSWCPLPEEVRNE